MRALGLSIDIPPSKKPTLRAVLLDDTLAPNQPPELSDIVCVDFFEIATTSDALAEQLKDLSVGVTGRLESLNPEIVVVRRADRPPRPSNQDGPRFRLLAEGAVAAAARTLVNKTTIRTGKECGAAWGSSKADVDIDAETLVSKRSLIPAAAAGLSGIRVDRLQAAWTARLGPDVIGLVNTDGMHHKDDQFSDVVTRVYEAQRHAGSLHGQELGLVGAAVASLAQTSGYRVLSVDSSGDRIIGAASVSTELAVADISRRFDGMSILLVAGMLAGPYGIERAAALARSTGAIEVHCVHMGGWFGEIRGCDSIRVVTGSIGQSLDSQGAQFDESFQSAVFESCSVFEMSRRSNSWFRQLAE